MSPGQFTLWPSAQSVTVFSDQCIAKIRSLLAAGGRHRPTSPAAALWEILTREQRIFLLQLAAIPEPATTAALATVDMDADELARVVVQFAWLRDWIVPAARALEKTHGQ